LQAQEGRTESDRTVEYGVDVINTHEDAGGGRRRGGIVHRRRKEAFLREFVYDDELRIVEPHNGMTHPVVVHQPPLLSGAEQGNVEVDGVPCVTHDHKWLDGHT
jgi:hypothetical protein